MNNEINIHLVQLERPETSTYIKYPNATSSQYLLYSSSGSLIPDSLDQVMKNSMIYSPETVCEEVPNETMEPTDISAPR